MYTKKDLKEFQKFAEQTALGAGKILHDGLNKSKKIRYKGNIDPVTHFDLKSEKYIVSKINKKYPGFSILAEEGSDKDTNSDYRWVIDPLDGTVNYAHSLPVYCVSIGLQYKENTIAGVIFDPERNELFSASLGNGSRLNGKKINVSSEKQLTKSLLATGFAYNIRHAKRNNIGTFGKMMKKAQAVRRLGSAALDLCWVATGRFEGFWEYYLHPWDTAAAILIVTEAGGKVTKIDGTKYSIFDLDILASNSHIHKQMMKAITNS